MRILLNGEAFEATAPATVASLVEQLGWDLRKVAVERNRTIVPRSQHVSTELAEGDEIEVVHFIGGG